MARRILIPIFALILTACGGGEAPPPTTDNTPPTQSSAQQPVDDTGAVLVARVNGIGITQAEFQAALARSQQLGLAADSQALARTVLDTLIEQEVIEQAAAKLGIEVTEAEIDTDISNMIVQAGSEDAWTQWMQDNLYTEADYRAATHSQLLTLRVRDQVTADTVAASGETVEQVHARHILVATEAEARDILTKLQNGESFETLSAEYSLDVTTRERGGDLGFFVSDDLTTPELAAVAFGLQPGEIAGPIATALGYHIIQTIEFADAPASPESIARQQETAFNEWLQTEMAKAEIERYLN